MKCKWSLIEQTETLPSIRFYHADHFNYCFTFNKCVSLLFPNLRNLTKSKFDSKSKPNCQKRFFLPIKFVGEQTERDRVWRGEDHRRQHLPLHRLPADLRRLQGFGLGRSRRPQGEAGRYRGPRRQEERLLQEKRRKLQEWRYVKREKINDLQKYIIFEK